MTTEFPSAERLAENAELLAAVRAGANADILPDWWYLSPDDVVRGREAGFLLMSTIDTMRRFAQDVDAYAQATIYSNMELGTMMADHVTSARRFIDVMHALYIEPTPGSDGANG